MIGIKDQCFGCETEMTGISRRTAAQVIADLFGTSYQHYGGYDAYHIIDRDGKEWKIVSDSSIEATARRGNRQRHIADSTYKVEMNSPKLEYSEMEKLQEAVRALRHAGAVVNPSCGMHVHVDGANHTPQSIKNVLSIMYSKEDILFAALNVNETRVSRWCQKVREPMLQKVRKLPKSATDTQLANIWYEGHSSTTDHYHWTRYYACNVHSYGCITAADSPNQADICRYQPLDTAISFLYTGLCFPESILC